ncbi:hypothetical protein PG994_010053 [Apiospora phragmitis]|uniref:Uncharacterized protein n=1 Tax=Apiospora phragmitis TaxID=2905665 RepID=A0ABR1TNZ9_9PEZI
MIHRLPDKPDSTASSDPSNPRRPSKYIVLIMGSTAVAGKVQIATTVAKALACPLYQGDSLHESSAKAASLGTSSSNSGSSSSRGPPNEQRYRRMWLSKMTRTGLLFPEESRPANEGFSGFGGSSSSAATTGRTSSPPSSPSSAISSRRGSAVSSSGSTSDWSSTTAAMQYTNHPPAFEAEPDAAACERRANPALMVLTHPQLEPWHKAAIRASVGEYGIGVVFVPLYHDSHEEEEEEEEHLPVLKPLDPRTMTSFGSFDQIAALSSKPAGLSLDEEIVLRVNAEGQIEELIREIVEGAREIMTVF